jgi:nucleotide-binding universal stress UspA family protein
MEQIGRGSIVVGIDGSPASDAALEWAVDDAVRRQRPLHLVHARGLDNWWYAAGTVAPVELAAIPDRVLDERVERARSLAPQLPVTGEAASDNAAPVLLALSERADTVVVGARGHGRLRGVLLRSVSIQMVSHALCPVVVVRGERRAENREGGVVVAVDGSAVSDAAVEYAFARAAEREVPLVALHAWWAELAGRPSRLDSAEDQQQAFVEERRRMLAETHAGWSDTFPDVKVEQRLVRAHPVEALVTESATADLLVVGSRGRGGFTGLLLGSVSLRTLQQAHSPVAVIRRPDEAKAKRQ